MQFLEHSQDLLINWNTAQQGGYCSNSAVLYDYFVVALQKLRHAVIERYE